MFPCLLSPSFDFAQDAPSNVEGRGPVFVSWRAVKARRPTLLV